MPTRWECRHSSSEMLYLEVAGGEVRMYFDHSPHRPERYSFDDVLAGKLDGQVNNLFGPAAVEELKAAVRERR